MVSSNRPVISVYILEDKRLMLMASLAFISSKSSQIWAGITEAGEIMQPLLL
jgi:hypothetical protein